VVAHGLDEVHWVARPSGSVWSGADSSPPAVPVKHNIAVFARHVTTHCAAHEHARDAARSAVTAFLAGCARLLLTLRNGWSYALRQMNYQFI
jgi:hypothetical protein